MLTSIDVKFIFDSVSLGFSSSANILQIADVALGVAFLLFRFKFRFLQFCKYSPNCRCCPRSWLLVVFATLCMFSAIISPSSSCSSYSWNKRSDGHFCFHNQNNSTVLTCSGLHFWRHFLGKHKILPNLVISNWLWWIMRVLLANQNWGNILKE